MSFKIDALPARPKDDWCGASLKERLAWFTEGLFVMFPDLVRLLRVIRNRHRDAKEAGKGIALLVIISSGGGKSHLIRLLQALMPRRSTLTQVVAPVVSFTVPARPTQDSMSQALRKAIGDPAWNSRPEEETSLERAVRLLNAVGTGIVCIDNVQDIPEHRGRRGLQVVGNWIRDLWDKSNCLILLLGTPAAKEVVWSNEQLRRRNPARVEVPYFAFKTKDDIARFKRFLQQVDLALPLARLCGLEEYAARIFWASYGIPDYIFGLLSDAVARAVRDGREVLTLMDLREAWQEYMLDSALVSGNPFDEDGPKRPLDQPGEPFHNWHNRAEAEARRGAAADRKRAGK